MARTKYEPLTVDRMLSSETKEIGSATSVLSKLFRIILADLNIKPSDYNRLVNQWLDDPNHGILDDPKKRSTIRGNLNKEIVRPDMSMRTFLKALSAATGTQRVTFSLTLHRKNSKRETHHEITIPNLPQLVAQLLHDSPDRTGRKVRTRKTIKAGESAVSFIEEKDLDSIANEMEEIASATILTHRKRGLSSYHEA